MVSSHRVKEPLSLSISIDSSGQMRLNEIYTGNIADPNELSDRLRSVFEDRDRTGISERGVTIEAPVTFDISPLVAKLNEIGAAPVEIECVTEDINAQRPEDPK